MNNTNWNTSDANNITYATTSDNITLTASTEFSNVWFPYYQDSTWLPYQEKKYKPEWHITLGYKMQFKSMWDNNE